jgi:uncharacterized protein
MDRGGCRDSPRGSKSRNVIVNFAAAFFISWWITPGVWAFDVPAFTAPVVDQAGVISSGVESRLNQELEQIYRSGGSQIAVLTVPSLNNEPIEQVSIQVTDKWKMGTGAKDNGVLLLIAPNDRQLRIEVGQGLEGDLPDAYAKRIVDDVIVPYLKAGDLDSGVVAGLQAILSKTDPSASMTGAEPPPRRGGRNRSGSLFQIIFFLLFFIISSIFGRRRRSAWGLGRSGHWGAAALGAGLGSMSGRGGFGGGGFGGGGGGGFSGGGASGRW